jgi:hypothetical protein
MPALSTTYDEDASHKHIRNIYEDTPINLGIKPLGFQRRRPLDEPRKEPEFGENSGVNVDIRKPDQDDAEKFEEHRKKVATLIAAVSAAAAVAGGSHANGVGSEGKSESLMLASSSIGNMEGERRDSSSIKSPTKKHLSKEERERNKEKRLVKLVGAVVVKCMSKYSKEMDHELFKKQAKEVRLSPHFCFSSS